MKTRIQTALVLATLAGFLLTPISASSQVVISEVGYDVDFNGQMKWVELHNRGSQSVDVADFVLCNFPSYSEIHLLTVLDGATTVPADGFVVVAWSGLGNADGEVGLYRDRSFTVPDSLIDYVEYGSTGHTRSDIARQASLWDTGQFVGAALSGETLARVEEAAPTFAERWASSVPSPGAANPTVTSVDDGETVVASLLGSPYPNPSTQTVSIPLALATAADVTLSLYDVVGRRVAESRLPFSAPGEHVVTVQTTQLPPGVYFSRVVVGGGKSTLVETARIVVQR